MLCLAAKVTIIMNSSECLVALVFSSIANILLPSKLEWMHASGWFRANSVWICMAANLFPWYKSLVCVVISATIMIRSRVVPVAFT